MTDERLLKKHRCPYAACNAGPEHLELIKMHVDGDNVGSFRIICHKCKGEDVFGFDRNFMAHMIRSLDLYYYEGKFNFAQHQAKKTGA